MRNVAHVVRILMAALLVGAVGLFTLAAQADLPAFTPSSPVFKQPVHALHGRAPLGFESSQGDVRGNDPAPWPAGLPDFGELADQLRYAGLNDDVAKRFLPGHGALKPRLAPFSMPTAAAAPTSRPPAVRLSQISLHFEPNQGQTDPAVQFLARGPGYGLFLTPTEAVLSLRRGTPTEPTAKTPSPSRGRAGVGGAEEPAAPPAVLRLSLTGDAVNPQPTLIGQNALSGKSNYFRGNDRAQWRTGIPHYGKVAYQQVYPGIDWVLYGNPRQLEYDFVIAPGVDPGLIEMRVSGAESVTLDEQGQLVLKVEGGKVVQPRPVIYQTRDGERRPIEGGYVLREGEDQTPLVGFQVAAYDRDRPLVIDPTLVYSTYLGGSGNDYGQGIAVDSTGDIYVTGYTFVVFPSTVNNFPTTPNTPQPTPPVGDKEDAFVVRFDAAGNVLYSTYLGGSDDDQGADIAVDGTGRAYVTGYTLSTDFPTTANAPQSTFGGGYSDVFVARLSAAGDALEYSTYLGGTAGGNEQGTGIAVDSVGRAYVTGFTPSDDFPIANAPQSTFGGGEDVFVARLTPAGDDLEYSTYLGGGDDDEYGYSIAVDGDGRAYVTGYTYSTDFPTTANAPQSDYQGGNDAGHRGDAFVVRLSAGVSPSLEYSTYLGGGDSDFGTDIAVDGAGRAYVTGLTVSDNFPTTLNALQPSFGGVHDAFVARLSEAGDALEYSTYLGGSSYDNGAGIAVDSANNAYVAGYTESTNFPTSNPLWFSFATAAGGNAFVARLSEAGAVLYSSYLGGIDDNFDEATDIAVDSAGLAYVTGYTVSSQFPTTADALQPAGAGNDEAFIAIISPVDPVLFTLTVDVEGAGLVTDDSGKIDCSSDGQCTATFPEGTAVELTAAPETGYDFFGWSGACTGTSPTCTVTMDQNRSVSARFFTTWTVTSTADSGPGSLRDMIADAGPGDTIDLTGLTGTIALTSGHIFIDKNLTLSGPGADQLTISGNNASRIFWIEGATVTLEELTLKNGRASAGEVGGAIINNGGTVTITNSTLSDNTAGLHGGAIANIGTLTVANSTLSGNQALGGGSGQGGAIFSNGPLTVVNSTLSGNTATDVGGGIYTCCDNDAPLTVINSTLSGNTATNGGGISNNSRLTISNSLVAGNTATTTNGPEINNNGTFTS